MRDKARHYIELMGLDKMTKSVAAAYVTSMYNMFGGDDMPTEAKAALGTVENAFHESEPALLERFVDVYASVFTEADLDGLIAFHESPIGRRVSELGPVAQQKVMEEADLWQAKVIKETSPRVVELMNEQQSQPEPQPQP